MTERTSPEGRIPSAARWVGAPFPEDAPWQATPEALVTLMDAKRVPWEVQELARRLLNRCRMAKTDKLFRTSVRKLAKEWSIHRATLTRRLRLLTNARLIAFNPDLDEHSPVIDLEPMRDALKECFVRNTSESATAPRGATTTPPGTAAAPGGSVEGNEGGAVVEPDVAPPSSQSWLHDGASTGTGSGSEPPHRRRRRKREEGDPARFHAPQGGRTVFGDTTEAPVPLDSKLADLIARKRPKNATAVAGEGSP